MVVEPGSISPQGISLPSGLIGDLPVASIAYQNKFFFVKGAPGTADAIYVCMKTSANTYTWVKWRDGDAGEFVTSVTGL